MAQTAGIDPRDKAKVFFGCKMFNIANSVASIERKSGLRGLPPHETLPVASQRELENPSVTG